MQINKADQETGIAKIGELIEKKDFISAKQLLDQYMDQPAEDPELLKKLQEYNDTLDRKCAEKIIADAKKLIEKKKYPDAGRKLREAKELALKDEEISKKYDSVYTVLNEVSEKLIEDGHAEIEKKNYKLAFRNFELAKKISEDNTDIQAECTDYLRKMEDVSLAAIERAREKIAQKDYDTAAKYLTYVKTNLINPPEIEAEIDNLLDGIKMKAEEGGAGPGSYEKDLNEPLEAEKISTVPRGSKTHFSLNGRWIAAIAGVVCLLGIIFILYSPKFLNLRMHVLNFIRGQDTEETASVETEKAVHSQTADGSAGLLDRQRNLSKASGGSAASQTDASDMPESEAPGTDASIEQNLPSAEQGNPEGAVPTDVAAVSEENMEQAGPNATEAAAAESDDTDAMLRMGDSYKSGENGEEPDYEKALEWYAKAAARGNPTAQKLYNDTLSYMSLTMEDGSVIAPATQKSRIAIHTGCSESNLHFLETAIITDGREGALYDYYDDNGNLQKEKFVIMSDGSVYGYLVEEGRLFSAEGYFN